MTPSDMEAATPQRTSSAGSGSTRGSPPRRGPAISQSTRPNARATRSPPPSASKRRIEETSDERTPAQKRANQARNTDSEASQLTGREEPKSPCVDVALDASNAQGSRHDPGLTDHEHQAEVQLIHESAASTFFLFFSATL